MKRILPVCVLALCALSFGCEESAEDQVLAQYQRAETAIAAMDVADWRATMSTDSVAWLQDVLRLTLDGAIMEVRALNPAKLEMVIALRNRLDADRLRSMNVESLMSWMIDEEMVHVDADYGVHPHSVMVSGDSATVQMGIEADEQSSYSPRFRTGRRGRGAIGSVISLASAASKKKEVEPIEGYTLKYVKIDGFWYSDNTQNMDEYAKLLRDSAKEAGVATDKYLCDQEKEIYGSLKPTIWLPVGR